MSLPVFFSDLSAGPSMEQRLPDETARHITSVLRMRSGDRLRLTDGGGRLAEAVITASEKKQCIVRLDNVYQQPKKKYSLTLAVSLLKNSNRFEWLLEKVTEIGINSIVPLICARTEKQHFRTGRMKNILISAMLQSQQTWLPELNEPVSFDQYINEEHGQSKFIAHCLPDEKKSLLSYTFPDNKASILIGPEGDFTPGEIETAILKGFVPVSLGETRLRSETAGIVAVTLLVNALLGGR